MPSSPRTAIEPLGAARGLARFGVAVALRCAVAAGVAFAFGGAAGVTVGFGGAVVSVGAGTGGSTGAGSTARAQLAAPYVRYPVPTWRVFVPSTAIIQRREAKWSRHEPEAVDLPTSTELKTSCSPSGDQTGASAPLCSPRRTVSRPLARSSTTATEAVPFS